MHVAQSWGELCVFHSALVFLGELLRRHAHLAPDTQEIERLMTRWGEELYKPQEPPRGMPAEHWWWFGPSPEQP